MMHEQGLNGFDVLAAVYDRLARLVYGKSIVAAQQHYLHVIPPQAHVLIVGGGTGWLLRNLLLLHPDCTVCYVEASGRMLAAAQKMAGDQAVRVKFIHGTEKAIPAELQFDVIITNFFLDLFTDTSLLRIVKHLISFLRQGGCWLVTDFYDGGKWWQRMLLHVMFIFFRTITGIESRRLADWNTALLSRELQQKESAFYFRGFIRSVVYRVQHT